MLFTGWAAPISAMSKLVLSQGNITIGSQDLTILVPTSAGPDNGFLCIDPSVINNWSRHAASRGVTSHSVTDDRTLMLDITQRRVFTESMSMFMQVGTIYSTSFFVHGNCNVFVLQSGVWRVYRNTSQRV